MSDQAQDMTKFNRIYHQIVEDSSYRRKVLNSLAVYGIFAVIGGIWGQLGPAFLDLQSICDVELAKGSWILTSLYIGYTLGALANGFLYHRCNGNLLFAVSALCLAVTVAAIPWCYMYSLMVVAHVVTGLLIGLIDTAGNSEIIRLWRTRSETVLVGLHVMFNVGGVISPIIIAPFLSPVLNTTVPVVFNIHTRDHITNVSFDVPINEMYNTTKVDAPQETSRIYVAYSLSSVLCLLSGSLFVCLYLIEKSQSKTMVDKDDTNKSLNINLNESMANNVLDDTVITYTSDKNDKYTSPVSKRLQMLGVGVMAIMLSLNNGVDYSFSTYLSSFCVEFLHWSKADGSFLTSLLFIMVVCGGLVGILLTKFINTIVYIGIQITLVLASLCLFIVSIQINSTLGVWFAAPLFGFARSTIFALVLTWTNTTFKRVTGKISSIFFVGAMGGCAVNLFILAAVTEEFGKIWFLYVLLIESTLWLLCYISAVILTKYVKHTQTINTPDINRNENNDQLIS